MDFAHRPEFVDSYETQRFENRICFHPQVRGRRLDQ
jgi:hypothetical protein